MCGGGVHAHSCSVAQAFQTLCNPMDCELSDSSLHGISQTRILEWVAMPSSRGSSRPREWIHVSCISCDTAGFLTAESPGKPCLHHTVVQYSCLENPMDWGTWWAAVHGVAGSQTWLSNFTLSFHFMHWRRKWQPTPVFLPGESQGWQSLLGCLLWGRTESDTTEVTWQQQQ